MADRLRSRRPGRAGRGAMAIMAGTAFGQVLAAAASPVLSRLYTPVDFGVFSIVNGLAMVLGAAMALRYEMAVPLPRADADARALFVAGALATGATTVVATIGFALLAPTIAGLADSAEVQPWLVWVPLIAAALASFRLLNQWALRQQRYAATARRNVVSAASMIAIQLLGGWRFSGAGGLVAGLGAGQALGAASLLPSSGLLARVSRADLARVARRFRRFPLLLMPAGVLNTAGLYVPVLLIAALYGAQEAGWFGFTQRILALPITLVGQAVAQVYLSELAKARRTGSDRQEYLFRFVSRRLALLGGAGALILLVAAPPLFSFVFGSQWSRSGDMAQALAIALALQLVASPLSQTLIVHERIVTQLIWDIGRIVLVSASVVVPATTGAGVLVCVWAYSIASAVAYGVSWWLSRRALRHGAQPRSAATT